MEELFGGALTIRDNFSNTFASFTGGISNAGRSFTSFTSLIGEAERANRVSFANMQKNMEKYTSFYISQGYSLNQAMKKATSSITDEVPTTGNKWADAFGKIKQVGTDAFEGIGQKVQNFSNSTLGSITKLTAGFISIKTAVDGIKEGFKTGMEYQNLRIMMNSLYGGEAKGGEKFNMATDFAAKTLWSEPEVVSSLARLKSLGIGDSKEKLTMMSDVGAFAKASGVGGIKSATEAYSDMLIGDWIRMTNILGIKRRQMEDFAKQNNMKAFSNKQGEITDKNALEQAFSAYIKKQGITGLTEKMGDTASGKLSTFMDNFKKSLANLVGITNSGEVKDGSLFDKFVTGLGKFTTKIQELSESQNFTKMSDIISRFGDSIYNGFSFVLDHPEMAGNLLKIGAALFVLGKIGSLASSISAITGLFGVAGTGGMTGAAMGLGSVLTRLIPTIGIVTGGFMALNSMFSQNGVLNKMMGEGLGAIFGDDVKNGWNENIKAISDLFNPLTDNETTKLGTDKWYGGKDEKTLLTDTSNIKFIPASDMVKNGDIVKTASNNVTNNYYMNNRIDKVEKTADIDEFMDTAMDKLKKYSNTRNNLG